MYKRQVVQMNGIPGVDTAEIMAQGATAVWAQNPDIKVLDLSLIHISEPTRPY